jgi:sialic acid synthase SpsE/protoporphyrinogen oxidase
MKKARKVNIIGAGPSGLITARELLKKGLEVVIYEKSMHVGGMCRSWKEDKYILDTGPHIYHTPDKELSDLWEDEFGDIMIKGNFWSKNVINGDLNNLVNYPISWEQIHQFDDEKRKIILKELVNCDQNKSVGANNFDDYVRGLVGDSLTEMFFTKYPEKVWGIPTKDLTADWAPKRIEIRQKITPFYHGQYAAVGKYGTGCIYDKIKDDIIELGGEIILDNSLIGVEYDDNISKLMFNDGSFKEIDDGLVISTIPITILGGFLDIKTDLEFRGIASVYIAVPEDKINWPNDAHWLYFDAEKYSFNRITNSTKMSSDISPAGQTLITIETTYTKGDELDLKSKESFEEFILDQVIDSKMIPSKEDVLFISSNKEPFVYPMQYPGFQLDLAKLKSRIENFTNLYSIGSGGDFNYADSQVIFYKAFDLVSLITKKDSLINQSKKNNTNRKFKKEFSIAKHRVGGNSNPIIIGEIGLNHNGNFEIAKKLIDKAVYCGLNFVKLQTYKSGNSRVSDKVKSANYIEKITEQEETLSQTFDKFNLSLEDQVKLYKYARSKDLILFSTPFDIESADFLNNVLNVDCFKIASVDLVNLPLISHVASFKKPMILSCGMSNLSEIEDALDAVSNSNNDRVILLHCNSSYPAPIEEMNLSVIKTLESAFKLPTGLSDHTFGLLASTISMSIGANVIERHFTLDRFMEGPDHILSSEPDEMKSLVDRSKQIPIILGDGIKKIQNGEYFNINLQRKCLYVNKDLLKGDIITKNDITIKGPGGGVLPKYIDIVLGRKLTQDIFNDYPITWEII